VIIESPKDQPPGREETAAIGGFHLLRADRERSISTAAALREINPGLVVPCHCTGEKAIEFLRTELPGRVEAGRAGMALRF